MNSHCQPLSPPAWIFMSPAARGAANTTLSTLARVTTVKGLVRLQGNASGGWWGATCSMSVHFDGIHGG